jgi:hypothetical protein
MGCEGLSSTGRQSTAKPRGLQHTQVVLLWQMSHSQMSLVSECWLRRLEIDVEVIIGHGHFERAQTPSDPIRAIRRHRLYSPLDGLDAY